MMNLPIFQKNSSVAANQQRMNPFLTLQRELNKVMGNFYDWFEPFNFPSENFDNLVLYPSIDFVDDPHEFKVVVEMPGMGEDDVNVSIDNGVLTIKGEKTTSKKDKDKNYMRREINYGSYERHLPLPDFIDVDRCKASFKKGMLWVTFPKKPECVKKERKIPIEKI